MQCTVGATQAGQSGCGYHLKNGTCNHTFCVRARAQVLFPAPRFVRRRWPAQGPEQSRVAPCPPIHLFAGRSALRGTRSSGIRGGEEQDVSFRRSHTRKELELELEIEHGQAAAVA